jgi:hypothetical protein
MSFSLKRRDFAIQLEQLRSYDGLGIFRLSLWMAVMKPYSSDVECTMLTFFGSLREKDRRRYAAVEAAKLGPAGVMYIAGLLGIDPNTVRKGIADLNNLPDVPPEDVRKKGEAAKER